MSNAMELALAARRDKLEKEQLQQEQAAKEANPDLASRMDSIAAEQQAALQSMAAPALAQGTTAANLPPSAVNSAQAQGKSQARLKEEQDIAQSAANVSTSSGSPMLTQEQLRQAMIQLGLTGSVSASVARNTDYTGQPRSFQHLFAGAGAIMPNGRRLTFGGRPGGVGIYTTDKVDEIAFLEELSHTNGSQVTEPGADPLETEFAIEQRQALADSRKNTLAELNPTVQAARQALGNTIAKNS